MIKYLCVTELRSQRRLTMALLVLFTLSLGCSSMRKQRKRSRIADDKARSAQSLLLDVNGEAESRYNLDPKTEPVAGQAKLTVNSIELTGGDSLKVGFDSELQCHQGQAIPRQTITDVKNTPVCGTLCLLSLVAMGTGGYYAAKADGDETKLYGGAGAAGLGTLIFSSYLIAGIDTTDYAETTNRLQVGDLARCAKQDTPVSLAATSGVRGEAVASWSLQLDDNAVRFPMEEALKGAAALEKKFSDGAPKVKKKSKRSRYRRNRYRRWNKRGAKRNKKKAAASVASPFQVELFFDAPWTCIQKADAEDSRFGLQWVPKGDSESSFLRKDGKELCFDWTQHPATREKLNGMRVRMASTMDAKGVFKTLPKLIKALKEPPSSSGDTRVTRAEDVGASLNAYAIKTVGKKKVPEDNGYPGEGGLRALAWGRTNSGRDVALVQRFVELFPGADGRYFKQADKAFWVAKSKPKTASGYKEYLTALPEGSFKDKALIARGNALIKEKSFATFFEDYGKDHKLSKKARSAFGKYVKKSQKAAAKEKDTGALSQLVSEIETTLGADDRQAKGLIKGAQSTLKRVEKKLAAAAKRAAAKRKAKAKRCYRKCMRTTVACSSNSRFCGGRCNFSRLCPCCKPAPYTCKTACGYR